MQRTWRESSRRRVKRIYTGGGGGKCCGEGGGRGGEKRSRSRGCEVGRLLGIVRRRKRKMRNGGRNWKRVRVRRMRRWRERR